MVPRRDYSLHGRRNGRDEIYSILSRCSADIERDSGECVGDCAMESTKRQVCGTRSMGITKRVLGHVCGGFRIHYMVAIRGRALQSTRGSDHVAFRWGCIRPDLPDHACSPRESGVPVHASDAMDTDIMLDKRVTRS